MNSLELSYDDVPEMDLSLAEAYLKENESALNSFTKRIFKAQNKIDIKLTLEKVINEIKANTDLIIQLEYMLRGILPECTKKELETLLEYFQFHAEISPILEKDELYLACYEEHHIYVINDFVMSEDYALSSLSFYAPVAITMLQALSICVVENTLPLMFLFKNIFDNAGFFQCVLYKMEESNFSNTLINFNSTMVVYEGSDLDSAVDTVMSAAWNNILSPWALKHISVQESVYKLFLAKLKERMLKFQWNLPANYQAKGYIQNVRDEMENLLLKANEDGIEHVKMHNSLYSEQLEYFKPLILLDNASWLVKYLEEQAKTKNVPVVCVQAFRTTKEALSLVKKNSSQAVSLWCDTNSICNEFAVSAPVNCVWINGFGYKSPNISFELKTTHRKLFSSFAGIANFELYRSERNKSSLVNDDDLSVYKNYVEQIVKVRQTWMQYSTAEKAKNFIKLLSDSKFGSIFNCDENSVRDCLKKVARLCHEMKEESSIVGRHICTNVYDSRGILVILYSKSANIAKTIEFILTAIAYGNGIILAHIEHNLSVELTEEEKRNHENIEKIITWLKINGIPVVYFKVDYNPDNVREYRRFGVFAAIDGVIDNRDCYKPFESAKFIKLLFCKCKTVWNTFGETFST